MPNLLSNFIFRKVFSIAVASPLLLLSSTITAEAKPIKTSTSVTFDFKGCARSSDGNDIMCVGNFRNRDDDNLIRMYRGKRMFASPTYITDSNGKRYAPDEIRMSNGESCKEKCAEIDVKLVEGANYNTYFVFKDISLPSLKIALLEIGIGYPRAGQGEYIKIRNIPVAIDKLSSSEPDSGENNNAASKPAKLSPGLQKLADYAIRADRGNYKNSWNILSGDLQQNKVVFPNGYNSFVDMYKDIVILTPQINARVISQSSQELIVNAPYRLKNGTSKQFFIEYTLNRNESNDSWEITRIKRLS
jgi:hypothetical protein